MIHKVDDRPDRNPVDAAKTVIGILDGILPPYTRLRP